MNTTLQNKGYTLGQVIGEGSYGKIRLAKNRSEISSNQTIEEKQRPLPQSKHCPSRPQIGKCPFGKRWESKLADFGFARKIENAQLSNTFCGSASYCPPEILQKKAYNAFAVDVWSMGVILYAMVNGGFPFEASNLHQMVECQLIKETHVGARSLRNAQQLKKS
ncbi:hypothetical protein KUTeg_013618 [Tegillarca granosa]|uniref:Protein kinase domain-containing protein n=1 Tax=Tegillarca granosa TaxID=220873 RepID=A0ABQ9EUK2_TEGGR|nr:hypothetical protein KUTeg_013618 [Tegillarca granosa]